MRLDSFFEDVAAQSISELDRGSENAESRAHWIVIRDSLGVERSRVSGKEGEIDVGEVLASHLANGCDAAAFVVHVSGDSEYLMAQALIADPREFDVRRAEVYRGDAGIRLGPWRHVIN